MDIDWTKPLELMDGTPVVFTYPDEPCDDAGDYYICREDRKDFTKDQFWKTNGGSMILSPDGRFWLHDDASKVFIRNRKEPTA